MSQRRGGVSRTRSNENQRRRIMRTLRGRMNADEEDRLSSLMGGMGSNEVDVLADRMGGVSMSSAIVRDPNLIEFCVVLLEDFEGLVRPGDWRRNSSDVIYTILRHFSPSSIARRLYNQRAIESMRDAILAVFGEDTLRWFGHASLDDPNLHRIVAYIVNNLSDDSLEELLDNMLEVCIRPLFSLPIDQTHLVQWKDNIIEVVDRLRNGRSVMDMYRMHIPRLEYTDEVNRYIERLNSTVSVMSFGRKSKKARRSKPKRSMKKRSKPKRSIKKKSIKKRAKTPKRSAKKRSVRR